MDPISSITGILDLIQQCNQAYTFLKDLKDVPKACSELIEELEIEQARLAELHEHVNRVEDKEKVWLSVSLQNYKKMLAKLDAILNKYRDPRFKFNFVARYKWTRSGEKKLKALHADLKQQNSGNFQLLLIQIEKHLDEMNKHHKEAEAKKAAEKLAGNGKTILISSVIDYLEGNLKHAGENIVLFAFADFQDTQSTDVVVLLRMLLAQLLDHCKPEDLVENPDFVELEKTMERHHADQPKFVQYLVELLGKASTPWKHMFIIIDALDEVEQDIIDVLSSAPTISLIEETWRVKADIARFIEVKMNESYLLLKHLSEPICACILRTLLEKANSMFCLVDCQLQSLAKAKLEKDIDKILENLPTDLNSMYERILQSVKAEGQEAAQIVQHILWWLVGSLWQLHLEEVMEAVMVEAGRGSPNLDLKPLSSEHLLEMCSSLVHHDTKTGNLTLSHASVQDFLFSGYLKETAHSDYHIPSFPFPHQHTTCLVSAYLQYRDFQNGPCTTPQSLAKHLEQHPFLVYVISNWHLHAAKMYETCSESGEQPTDIHTLFALSDDSEKCYDLFTFFIFSVLSHLIGVITLMRYCHLTPDTDFDKSSLMDNA
ncbi:hypothetical protein IW262DRAFT_1506498 [Armillaria fumosa]|nr:hypothetical protein IW262DRAFT_1506498 [Armillaria fumosa]